MDLKILSFNIHKGMSIFNGQWTLEDIRWAIREVHADIVFLQEITGENKKQEKKWAEVWPKESQFEFLADEVWKHYAYAKNAVYDHGHHGNAILSKYPIIEFKKIDISTNSFEQRGILYAKIKHPNKDFHIHTFCIHLNLFRRKKQYEMLIETVKKLTTDLMPIIIAGDFNDWHHSSCKYFENDIGLVEVFKKKLGYYPKTYPSFFPLLGLDRIYAKNFDIIEVDQLNSGEWRKISDHTGLLVKLKLSKV